MIEAEGLTKRYGPTVALAGIDLQVPAGSILGMLGPNGAGKTTALRILTTLSLPDDGWARVAGHDVVREAAAVQRNIGVTAQDATVDEVLTGRQNLVMIGRLSGLRRRQARARAAELLDQFDLADAADRMLKEYSGGMRRRLDLAAGLVTRPPVLFLDEPTTGLDPASRLRMWNVIRELVAGGVTLLLTTQYLDEADELADRIVVIDHGHVIAEGDARRAQDADRGSPARGHPHRSQPRRFRRPGAVRVRPRPPEPGRSAAAGTGTQRRRPGQHGRARPRRRRDHRRRRGGPSALARRRVLRAHRPSRGASRGTRRTRPGGSPVMTLTTLPSAAPVLRPAPSRRLAQRFADVLVLTGRNLVHIAREPLQLSDVTIQPVLFTLLFVYVFGSGVVLPGGGSYTDFAIAGLLALNLTTSAMGTAVGLSNDLNSGVIDRFRTLPMWRAAVLVGRSLADLSTAALCTLIVALTGLVIGWRPDASIPAVIGGFALFLLFAYALSWGCGCLGIVSKGPESAQGVGLVILFPLAIVSNGLVPTQRMPAVLRVIADWNPVSAVTAAARHLWGNPNPSATIHAWPMQHPVAASLLWSVALLVIFAPLATLLYRRRTTG